MAKNAMKSAAKIKGILAGFGEETQRVILQIVKGETGEVKKRKMKAAKGAIKVAAPGKNKGGRPKKAKAPVEVQEETVAE